MENILRKFHVLNVIRPNLEAIDIENLKLRKNKDETLKNL